MLEENQKEDRYIYKELKEKINECLSSVLPITIIVLVLCFTVAPVSSGVLLSFIIGAVLIILGMGLFTLGVDVSMTPMGNEMGSAITKSRKMDIIILCCFLLGALVTIAEPDLQVLAEQVATIPNQVLIFAVAAGVGVFMVVAVLRTLFQIKLNRLLIILYILCFVLAFFVPNEFIAIAFDSGGVTTGPMTVPFIMAMGVGVAAIRSDSNAREDSFGLVALCSVGPILAVLILGLIYRPEDAVYSSVVIPDYSSTQELWSQFLVNFPEYFGEVALALSPIIVFFFIFQVATLKLSKRRLIKIAIGLVYTFLGLVLFLTGVNVGFAPAGNYIGQQIASLDYNWIIIPIGMLMGYFIVAAEPAVHVLNRQVLDLSDGLIEGKALMTSLSIGVAISLGLAMVRVLTGISIFWFLIPGYALALILTRFSPQLFTSVAFDSGGVASGPMAATFVLPFAMGACEALGGNVITDAFGTVAMIAMTPLITIQILGVHAARKQKKAQAELLKEAHLLEDIEAFTADIDIVEMR